MLQIIFIIIIIIIIIMIFSIMSIPITAAFIHSCVDYTQQQQPQHGLFAL